jgi:hypothetical protein
MADEPQQGYFSLLRWRTDPVRDEARNVAVVLVEERGGFCAFKPAPLSTISAKLHEQGLLDSAIVALGEQADSRELTLERLTAMHGALHNSLYITEPKPVAVSDPDEAVRALFKAYVAPRYGPTNRQSKGAVLDRVVNAYRKRGLDVKRGHYINDFIFDAVVDKGDGARGLEVLSFASPRKDWAPIERDAGHFLFALQELEIPGRAVIQPPTDASRDRAGEPYDRVRRWLDKFDVPVMTPDEALDPNAALI